MGHFNASIRSRFLPQPIISLVVARGQNGVIGRDGDLPWRLRSDLQRFKAITVGKPCLMGRKTWESLPARFRPKVLTLPVRLRLNDPAPLDAALDRVLGARGGA